MLDLHFLTSSRTKLDHIRYLLREYAINVRPPVDYGKPYIEPKIKDRGKLLEQSIRDASRRLSKLHLGTAEVDLFGSKTQIDVAQIYRNRMFIIEDTSVIIDQLSSEDQEFPGVDVKFWMQETTFEKLDKLLVEGGNNRNVRVRSDIVLYLPPQLRQHDDKFYITFTGFSKGKIDTKERIFETNHVYPWLDNEARRARHQDVRLLAKDFYQPHPFKLPSANGLSQSLIASYDL